MLLISHISRNRQPKSILTLLLLVVILIPTISPLSINYSSPTSPRDSLGVNCRGSIFCPMYLEAFPPNYIGTFISITNGKATHCPPSFSCGPLNDTELYLPNDHIVCLPLGRSFLGGICAFTQGNNAPATGIIGALIKRKLQELSDHGCRVCGSVPLSEDNDPGSLGILTVNYIGGVVCRGLCPSKHYTAFLQTAANESWVSGASVSLVES